MEHYNVFGLKVSNYSLQEVDQLFDQTIQSEKNIVIYGHSFGGIPNMKIHPELYAVVNSFDLLVCDGTPFNWFCNFFGFKLKTVMSIPDMTNYTLEYAHKNHLKVLLLGANEEINTQANKRLSIKYPGAHFLEGINGYFNPSEEYKIVTRINELSPDILLIGISSPIKERFACNYKNDLKTNIIIPCGGMIDVYAGKTKQTPKLIKKLGLATAYRIIQEPRRLLRLHSWMVYETIFKILPLALYYRLIYSQKDFNLMDKYLKL